MNPPNQPTNWEIARGAIEHENLLTNQRIQWLLTAQGFLFTAFALILQSTLNKDGHVHWFAWWGIYAIAIFGVVLCAFVYKPLKAASLHHDHVRDWWNKHEGKEYQGLAVGNDEEKLEERNYPRIAGTHLNDELGGFWNPAYLPIVMSGVWFIILLGAIIAPLTIYL